MDNKESVRLFVAIDLPEEIMQEVIRAQQWLIKQNLFTGIYADTTQAHSTLQFIGSVSADQIQPIADALQSIKIPPAQAQLNKLNYFARGSFITVIFLGFSSPELTQLGIQINQQLHPWVEPTESFVPHITLSRVKSVPNREKLIQSLQLYQVPPITFTIDSFTLKLSVLHPEGALHTTIQHYPLTA